MDNYNEDTIKCFCCCSEYNVFNNNRAGYYNLCGDCETNMIDNDEVYCLKCFTGYNVSNNNKQGYHNLCIDCCEEDQLDIEQVPHKQVFNKVIKQINDYSYQGDKPQSFVSHIKVLNKLD